MRPFKPRKCGWCGCKAVAFVSFEVKKFTREVSLRKFPLCEYHLEKSSMAFELSLRAMTQEEVKWKHASYSGVTYDGKPFDNGWGDDEPRR